MDVKTLHIHFPAFILNSFQICFNFHEFLAVSAQLIVSSKIYTLLYVIKLQYNYPEIKLPADFLLPRSNMLYKDDVTKLERCLS
ncbi:unnamed protein product [Paramecium octaurelia]|uniref:Uncharacterized protein n=1 Tax=Paramecium octaurelia TaxID=43137 RepID=A0A8S1YLF6_PAROT|nr:unnamed protein product [Paramecium octaurelia]